MTDQTQNTPLAHEPPYPLLTHLGFVLTEWKEDFCRLELPREPFFDESLWHTSRWSVRGLA